MSPVLTDAVLDARASICLRGCDQIVIGGDLASIDPAALEPIGAVSAWRGSGPISGAWWSSTLGINVEVGNQRERDAVMLEDFSGDLRLVATRPMRLTIPAVDGDLRPSHLIQRASGHWDLLLTDPVEPALREAFSRVTGFRLHSPALLDHLSALITLVNEKFGAELTDADKLTFEQARMDLMRHDDMRIVAENNDRAQYNIVLEDRADDIILERGQRNGQLFDAYFANPAIRRVFIDYLASTYDEFRSAAR